ncbi:hypothetical protein GCM10022258_09820 [Aquimarina gracilis]
MLLSCSNDDDSSSSSELSGTWSLINVSGGFVGLDHDFNTGIVVWVFNESSNTVSITNNNTDDSIEDLLPTGTYDYSIETVGENREFILDNINRGNFEIMDNQLTINEQFRDGFNFTFIR